MRHEYGTFSFEIHLRTYEATCVLQITHDDNNKKYDSFFKRENG